jgi:N-acetylglutamate synthase-like GNAT family acetyltransferase
MDGMITGIRRNGAASLYVRQCTALPEVMRAKTREVAKLEVQESKQNQGYATSLMHKVCREADEAGLMLVLWPQPFGDNIRLSKQQLIEWYEREFGFMIIQPHPVLMARLLYGTPKKLALKPLTASLYAR